MSRILALLLLLGAISVAGAAPRVRLPAVSRPYLFYTNYDTGADAGNDCRAEDQPCKTLQYALEKVSGGFDFENASAQIWMACDVTDRRGVHFSFSSYVGLQGGAALSVHGCGPTRSRIHKTGGHALGLFYVPAIEFHDVGLSSDTSCLDAHYKTFVDLFNVWFFGCGLVDVFESDHARVTVRGDYSIVGSSKRPFIVSSFSTLDVRGKVTIAAPLDFSAFVTMDGPAKADFRAATFLNPQEHRVRGAKYDINFGAYVLGSAGLPGEGGNVPIGGGGAF